MASVNNAINLSKDVSEMDVLLLNMIDIQQK